MKDFYGKKKLENRKKNFLKFLKFFLKNFLLEKFRLRFFLSATFPKAGRYRRAKRAQRRRPRTSRRRRRQCELEFKVGELIKKLFERKRRDFRMLVALQHFYNDCVSYVFCQSILCIPSLCIPPTTCSYYMQGIRVPKNITCKDYLFAKIHNQRI